jgi:hypothetical protein
VYAIPLCKNEVFYQKVSLIITILNSETNLKCRQAFPETAELADDIHLIGRFNGINSQVLNNLTN